MPPREVALLTVEQFERFVDWIDDYERQQKEASKQ